ncbi:MAG: acyltransferase [Proteobacteria bacterium]|nr:MAG: acyltransferase [Pseudomonadota bacterium]
MNKKNPRASRLSGIDLMRCFLALCVIFLHMKSKSRYPDEVNNFINNLGVYLGGAVAGFFLISGFFTRQQEKLALSQLWTGFKKNLVRLGIPFFFFSILYAIIQAGMKKSTLSKGLINSLTLQGSSMQLYFLPYLFYIVLAFLVVSSVLGQLKSKQLCWMVGLTVILLFVAESMRTPAAFGADVKLLPLYAAMFILGNCFATLLRENKKAFAVFSVVVLIGFGILAFNDIRFIGLTITLILFLLAIALSSAPFLQGKSFYGSGGVYLLHTPLLNFTISTIVLRLGISGFANLFVSIFLTFAVCLALTVWFVSRYKSMRYLLLE